MAKHLAPLVVDESLLKLEDGSRLNLRGLHLPRAIFSQKLVAGSTDREMLTFLGIALLYSSLGTATHTCFPTCLRPCTGTT